MNKISVISPVYRAEKILPVLVSRIESALKEITLDYEIILVEDRSPDNSWQEIEKIASSNNKVKGIRLSRNFGQHYAITAGLDHCTGDWIVVMDCDLQDRPEEISNFYRKALEGYDIVLGRRIIRQDSFFKRLSSRLFHILLGYLTGTTQDKSIANFGIYHKKVVDAICKMREPIRFFPSMVKWVGFKTEKIDIQHDSRFEGKTSYSLLKLLSLSMDIIMAYSLKPISLLFRFGLLVSLGSFLFIVIQLIRWYNGENYIMGYTSLIVSIWFFSGVIISTISLVGIYVGKTFEGVKNRPIYLIDEKLNC